MELTAIFIDITKSKKRESFTDELEPGARALDAVQFLTVASRLAQVPYLFACNKPSYQ